jgi:tetratricopeptide (TPR) repeat protein
MREDRGRADEVSWMADEKRVPKPQPGEPRAIEAAEIVSGTGKDEPAAELPPAGVERPKFSLEVAGENASEAIKKLKDQAQYWVDRGRYNKVRIKRGGKAVLPDIPVGALVAFEAATFFWTGLLRGAIVNTVGRAFFEVELINEAEEHYKRGLEHFLSGDLGEADECLQKALRIDDRYPRAHLQLAVLRKVQGRRADAIKHFERVIALDPHSDASREAEVHLKKLREL